MGGQLMAPLQMLAEVDEQILSLKKLMQRQKLVMTDGEVAKTKDLLRRFFQMRIELRRVTDFQGRKDIRDVYTEFLLVQAGVWPRGHIRSRVGMMQLVAAVFEQPDVRVRWSWPASMLIRAHESASIPVPDAVFVKAWESLPSDIRVLALAGCAMRLGLWPVSQRAQP